MYNEGNSVTSRHKISLDDRVMPLKPIKMKLICKIFTVLYVQKCRTDSQFFLKYKRR